MSEARTKEQNSDKAACDDWTKIPAHCAECGAQFLRKVRHQKYCDEHRHLAGAVIRPQAAQTSKTITDIVRHADLLLESGDEVLCLTRDEWRQIKAAIGAVETTELERLRDALLTIATGGAKFPVGYAATVLYGERSSVESEKCCFRGCDEPPVARIEWGPICYSHSFRRSQSAKTAAEFESPVETTGEST